MKATGSGLANRASFGLAILCIGGLLAVSTGSTGCGTDSTPDGLKCHPAVVSEQFVVSVGCGTGGPITLSTTADSCDISVSGGRAAEVPFTGYFLSAGADGGFDLNDGNWILNGNVRFSSSPPIDNNVNCNMIPQDGGAFLASCTITNCMAVGEGEDEGSSCSNDLCMALFETKAEAEAEAAEEDAGDAGSTDGGDETDAGATPDAAGDAGTDASLDGGG